MEKILEKIPESVKRRFTEKEEVSLFSEILNSFENDKFLGKNVGKREDIKKVSKGGKDVGKSGRGR